MKFKLNQIVKSRYSGEHCTILQIKFGTFYLYLVEFNTGITHWFYQAELANLEEKIESNFIFYFPKN